MSDKLAFVHCLLGQSPPRALGPEQPPRAEETRLGGGLKALQDPDSPRL